MNKFSVLKFNNSNAAIVDGNLVIDKGNKIFIFKEFEAELLNLFDGKVCVDTISEQLKNKYPNTYIENEFLDFVIAMMERGIIEEIG